MTWQTNSAKPCRRIDWVESVYTIAYSKPWVEAIPYWDFNGKGHDDFVTREGKPRESYHCLRGFLAKWRDEGRAALVELGGVPKNLASARGCNLTERI